MDLPETDRVRLQLAREDKENRGGRRLRSRSGRLTSKQSYLDRTRAIGRNRADDILGRIEEIQAIDSHIAVPLTPFLSR